MTGWFPAIVSIAVIACIAISIFYLAFSFIRYPLRNCIRSLAFAFLSLVGNLAAPSFEGKANASLDWGWILKGDVKDLIVSTGPSEATLFIAMLFTGLLWLAFVSKLPAGTE